MKTKLCLPSVLALTAFSLTASAALVTYPGIVSGSPDSYIVSQGTLTLSGTAGSAINFNFTRGGADSATMGNYLVLFLDTQAGGYNSTVNFTPNGNDAQRAISGLSSSGTSRSTANFANGFLADYALVIGPNVGAQVYQLGADSFTQVASPINHTMSGTARTYSFSVGRDTLGMGGTDALRFQSTYIAGGGYRYLESFEHMTGNVGFTLTSFGEFNLFDVQAVPEPTTVALGLFCGLGGIVVLAKRIRRSQYRAS